MRLAPLAWCRSRTPRSTETASPISTSAGGTLSTWSAGCAYPATVPATVTGKPTGRPTFTTLSESLWLTSTATTCRRPVTLSPPCLQRLRWPTMTTTTPTPTATVATVMAPRTPKTPETKQLPAPPASLLPSPPLLSGRCRRSLLQPSSPPPPDVKPPAECSPLSRPPLPSPLPPPTPSYAMVLVIVSYHNIMITL